MFHLVEEQKFSNEEHAQIVKNECAYVNLHDDDYFVRIEDGAHVAYVCCSAYDSCDGVVKHHEVIWRAPFTSFVQAMDFVNTAHACDSGAWSDSVAVDDAWTNYNARYAA